MLKENQPLILLSDSLSRDLFCDNAVETIFRTDLVVTSKVFPVCTNNNSALLKSDEVLRAAEVRGVISVS